MVREYLSIIIVKQMNTVTMVKKNILYKWLPIHGKRILIHYYCKENEHSY